MQKLSLQQFTEYFPSYLPGWQCIYHFFISQSRMVIALYFN